MLMNSAIAAAVLAAFAGQATAASVHRHLHQEAAAKRGVETEVVTIFETVTVTFGQEAAAAPTANVHVEQAPAPEPSTKPEPAVKVEKAVKKPAPSKPAPSKQASKPKSGSSLPGKRGIAYNDAGLANAFGGACKSCGWGYNWASTRGDLDSKYNFVPMLWGDRDEFTSVWEENCEQAISSGSTHVFSFNEPDHASQAALDPVYAAQLHAKHMNKFAGRVQIGAPSVTNSGNPGEGLEWLKSFMDACNAQDGGCPVDFCNVHWYSQPQYANTLFEHLEKAREICNGKKVWLTEFAPIEASDEQLAEFIKDVIPKLDGLDYLDAYSYFMVAEGNLMSSSSSLSSYGQAYATV